MAQFHYRFLALLASSNGIIPKNVRRLSTAKPVELVTPSTLAPEFIGVQNIVTVVVIKAGVWEGGRTATRNTAGREM